MYSLEQIRKGLADPKVMISEINRLVNHTLQGCDFNATGIEIFDEDWDNLIILDACRYDFFVDAASLPGTTEQRESRGATTREFIRGNFTGKSRYDTVYVSANPWYPRLQDELESVLHDYIDVHSGDKRDAVDGLTTRPETVTAHAQTASEQYQNKRLIVHYLQPHQPYLGEFGRDKFDFHGNTLISIKRSDVSRDDVVRAYRENLELVLSEVHRLLSTLHGKTVVTADHGELLGDRQRPIPIRHYGHPCGVYVEELVKVPWHVVPFSERKTIVSEEPSDAASDRLDSSELDEQLSALGYRT